MEVKKRLLAKDLASETGISTSTIRRLADRGMIDSRKDWNGWRVFSSDAIKQLKEIAGIVE